ARRLGADIRAASPGARFGVGPRAPPGRIRRLARGIRHDAQLAPHLPTGWRAHPVLGRAALAPQDRAWVLGADRGARRLLEGLALVGRARAAAVAWAPRPPAGAGRAPAAAAVAPQARLARARPVSHPAHSATAEPVSFPHQPREWRRAPPPSPRPVPAFPR